MEVQERSSPCQYNYFVLYYVLHYKHDEATLDSQKVSFEGFNLPPTPQMLGRSRNSVLLYFLSFENLIDILQME